MALSVDFSLARPSIDMIKASPWSNCGPNNSHVVLSGVSVVIAPPPTSSVTVSFGGVVDENVYGGMYSIDIQLKSIPIQVYSGPLSQVVATPVYKGKFNFDYTWNFGLTDAAFRDQLAAANVTAPEDYGYSAKLEARDQTWEVLFCIQAYY